MDDFPIGVPFKDGGRGPTEGFDCWGLVLWYYRTELQVELHDYNIGAYNSVVIAEKMGHAEDNGWTRIMSRQHLRKHDLVSFALDCAHAPGLTTHVGIWTGDGDRFLHCLERKGVIQSRLGDSFWRLRTSGYFRWTGLQQ